MAELRPIAFVLVEDGEPVGSDLKLAPRAGLRAYKQAAHLFASRAAEYDRRVAKGAAVASQTLAADRAKAQERLDNDEHVVVVPDDQHIVIDHPEAAQLGEAGGAVDERIAGEADDGQARARQRAALQIHRGHAYRRQHRAAALELVDDRLIRQTNRARDKAARFSETNQFRQRIASRARRRCRLVDFATGYGLIAYPVIHH